MRRHLPLSSALIGVLAVLVAVSPAAGQTETHCAPGSAPTFTAGFQTLSLELGATMGEALTCEYPDPLGTGDVEQHTSSGLAFWRKSTNTPTFTNGAQHWAATASGWRTWPGASVDPPSNAQPFVINRATRPAGEAPSALEITSVMSATVEVGTPSEHFEPRGPAVTIADGYGGTLTAAAAQRVPTADAHGQLTFFWHNTDFIGLDADYESVNVMNIASPGAGIFVITYPTYALSDAMCCPSMPPTTVTYQWDGQALRGTHPPPMRPDKVYVTIAS